LNLPPRPDHSRRFETVLFFHFSSLLKQLAGSNSFLLESSRDPAKATGRRLLGTLWVKVRSPFFRKRMRPRNKQSPLFYFLFWGPRTEGPSWSRLSSSSNAPKSAPQASPKCSRPLLVSICDSTEKKDRIPNLDGNFQSATLGSNPSMGCG